MTPPHEDEIVELKRFPVALVADCLERLEVAHPTIRPISSNVSFCGRCATVIEYAGLNSTIHKAAAMLEPGQVLAINGQGHEARAIWGASLNDVAALRGAAAVVVDGAVRDVTELRASPHPVFCRAVTAAGPLKGELGRINCTTCIGGVTVVPGDIMRGDDDGVVVIPQGRAAQVIARCHEEAEKESASRKYIATHRMTKIGRDLLLKDGI